MASFKIGDQVSVKRYSSIKGSSTYNHLTVFPDVPLGTIGTVISIREKYKNFPNHYFQYKVRFPGIPDGDDLINLYYESSLVLVN